MNKLTIWFIYGLITILIMLNDIRKSDLTIAEVLNGIPGCIVILGIFISGPVGLLLAVIWMIFQKYDPILRG